MQISIPPKAKDILETIQSAGYEAYVVGGCVRDSILGRVPQDWDITTSALPTQVKALFPRTIDTGIAHGTVTVMAGKEGFEVTTYRIDGEYEDARHPKEVTFTPSLEEDLKRRDFTINAMAYNEQTGLVDLFGGMEDIAEKKIRCVGEPRERFGEDALRMLRAVRFSAQLGYEIEEDTARAISELAPNLTHISAERIQAELIKLVVSDHPEYLEKAYETGITGVVLPEFDRMMETPQNHPHHCYHVGMHSLTAMREIAPKKHLRLAMLFHDIGKPLCRERDADGIDHFHGHAKVSEGITREILKRLKFDNETLSIVSKLVLYHDYITGVVADEKTLRKAINHMGEEVFPDLFDVNLADILAQSDYKRQEKLANLEDWKAIYQRIREGQQCVSLKTLAVTGKDLIALGMPPGRELGEVLQRLLDIVLDDPGQNRKEILLEEAKKDIPHTF